MCSLAELAIACNAAPQVIANLRGAAARTVKVGSCTVKVCRRSACAACVAAVPAAANSGCVLVPAVSCLPDIAHLPLVLQKFWRAFNLCKEVQLPLWHDPAGDAPEGA